VPAHPHARRRRRGAAERAARGAARRGNGRTRARRRALFAPGAPRIWGKVLKGALRSSAFLALYCTLCWRGACAGFQATGSCAPQVIAGSAWAGAPRACRGPMKGFSARARHVCQPCRGARL